MANYVQPDYRNPVTPGVTVQIENSQAPGNVLGNPLQLTTASLVDYIQTGTNQLGVEIVKAPPKGTGILSGN